MSELAPCPGCQRHCRIDAPCPFCGAAQPPVTPRPTSTTSHRLSRAAIFAGAAFVAPACWSSPSHPSSTTTPPSTTADDAHAGTGRLTGTVTNIRTRLPAPGEAIWIRKTGETDFFERSTTTADDGSYAFDALPAGDYEVVFPSYQRRRRDEDDAPRGTRVTIKRGEVTVVDQAIVAYDPNAPEMPYGAPPVRRRIV